MGDSGYNIFAGVHDFGALWASSRHKGKSIGALSEDVIGKERVHCSWWLYSVLLMVNAVFGVVIAGTFVSTPNAVFPAWSAIVVALIIGQLIHQFQSYVVCYWGDGSLLFCIHWQFIPLELPEGC